MEFFLGANPSQIGLIVSITSLLSIFQIIWARLADKLKNSRLIAIISNYASSVFNFLFIIVKNFGYFVSMRGIQSLSASASIPTSSSILAERTQTKDWPFWNSFGQAFLVLGTLIGVLVGGFLLSRFSNDLGFMIIFIVSGVVSVLGALFFHIAVPKKSALEKKKRWYQVEEVSVNLDNILAVMKTDRNFIRLSLASFIFRFGVNFSAPFYIIYNTSASFYSLTISQTAILCAMGLIPQIIFSIFTIKFIEKLRTKEVLIIGTILTSFFPIIFLIPYLTGMMQNIYPILIILWVVNGMVWGVINSGLLTLTLNVIHPRRRILQLAIYNSLNSIALFIAPILGGLAIPESVLRGEAHISVVLICLIFIIGAAFRLLGGLLFIRVKEPVIGGTILRPINKILSYPIRSNIEKTISTIIVSSEKILHRRKVEAHIEKKKPRE